MNQSIRAYHDKELFTRISENDEQAFSALFHQYIGILRPFVFSFTRSDAVADELIQDIFTRVWLGRDKLAAVETPKAWLFKVAANECYRHLRKKILEQRTFNQYAAQKTSAADSTSDHMNVQEIKRLVADAIQGLAPRQKRIYEMSRNGGLKIEEIAGQLDLSPHTVKNVLVTTARIIRTRLEKAGYHLPLLLVSLWLK